jgi:hypothetical protein
MCLWGPPRICDPRGSWGNKRNEKTLDKGEHNISRHKKENFREKGTMRQSIRERNAWTGSVLDVPEESFYNRARDLVKGFKRDESIERCVVQDLQPHA